jgi:hypothetical protein
MEESLWQKKSKKFVKSSNSFVIQFVKFNRYGIIKKEGPPASPWTQGCVERCNQTIKDMLKSVMLESESREWESKFRNIIETYNNKIHNTIKMSPNEAWKSTFTLSPETLSVEERLRRIYVLNEIKKNIEITGEAYRKRVLDKNASYIEEFKVDEYVLVRVPKKYRSSISYLWGRKGQLVEQQKTPGGELLPKWRVKWLETGGIKKNEPPFSMSKYFINERDLKHFILGCDIYLETNEVDVNKEDDVIEYDEEDYGSEEMFCFQEDEERKSEANENVDEKLTECGK